MSIKKKILKISIQVSVWRAVAASAQFPRLWDAGYVRHFLHGHSTYLYPHFQKEIFKIGRLGRFSGLRWLQRGFRGHGCGMRVMFDSFGMNVVLTYPHLLKKKFLKSANWAVFSGPRRLCRTLWRPRAAGRRPPFKKNIHIDPQGLPSNFQPIWQARLGMHRHHKHTHTDRHNLNYNKMQYNHGIHEYNRHNRHDIKVFCNPASLHSVI